LAASNLIKASPMPELPPTTSMFLPCTSMDLNMLLV
jgi:hypothetical protein